MRIVVNLESEPLLPIWSAGCLALMPKQTIVTDNISNINNKNHNWNSTKDTTGLETDFSVTLLEGLSRMVDQLEAGIVSSAGLLIKGQ